MNTTNLTVEQIKAEIELQGDGSYFDHTFAKWVAANFDVHEEDVQRAVRFEAQDNIEDGRYKGRGKEGKAQKQACENILMWLTEAHEYALAIDNLANLASFALSHRRACVWAILTGKRRAK